MALENPPPEALGTEGLNSQTIGSYLRYSGWTGSKEVIAQLVRGDSVVLDVGCSSGVLGNELRRRRNCSVYGIEVDQQAAEIAKRVYEKVFLGDIQTLFDLPVNYTNAFDFIIFADVLEHTTIPDKVLKHYLRYIKKNGSVIISLPNVANWLNRLQLLVGKWEYKDFGTLDRTHLRFYNYSGARKLILDSGLSIDRIDCTSGLHSLDFKARLHNPAKLWKSVLAYQFIFKCNA